VLSDADVGLAPAAPPKREVGAGTAGLRGLAQGAANLGGSVTMMAGAPLATAIDWLTGAATGQQSFAARDRLFRGVDRAYDSGQAWAINPNTESVTTAGKVANMGGNLVSAFLPVLGTAGALPQLAAKGVPLASRLVGGAATALPVTVPLATQAAAEGVRAGATTAQALGAGTSSLLINTAAGALPLSLAGSLPMRVLTGGAIGAPSGAADQAARNAIYSDIQSLQGDVGEAAAFGGGLNAGLAALFGPRAPRFIGRSPAATPAAGAAAPAQPAVMLNTDTGRILRADVGDPAAQPPADTPGATLSDAIARAILGQVDPQTQPDPGMRATRQAELADAFPADPSQPTPVLRREDFVPDPANREMVPVRPDLEPQPIYDATGTLVDPAVADARRPQDRAYVEQGISPQAAENAFARARSGAADTLEGRTGPERRTLRAELEPQDLDLIGRYTGLEPAEIAALGPNSQRRLLARAMEAQGADQARTDAGPMAAQDITRGTGGDGPLGPASRPIVPGDRVEPQARTFDENEAAAQRPPDPKAVARKQADLKALDAARQQRDRIIDSPVMRDTQRKLDAGERISEAEQKAYNAARQQLDAVSKRVRDLESRIYQTEGRSEAGSRATSGIGDRPFRPGDDPNAELYRQRAEEQARQAEQAELDKLEAEWRARRDAEAARKARQEGEARRGEGKPEDRYKGMPRSDTAQKEPDGTFRTDGEGFVMSDQGAPIWFGHQRDAGRWILGKGNKQSPGQVYEIANHPEGKGFTVRVTTTRDDLKGGGPKPGDQAQQPKQPDTPAVEPGGQARPAEGTSTPEPTTTAKPDEPTAQAQPEPQQTPPPEPPPADAGGAKAADAPGAAAGADGAGQQRPGVKPDPGKRKADGNSSDIEQKQVLDGVRGKTSSREIAQWLSETAPSPVHRTIAKAVHSTMTALEGMGMKFEFKIAERGAKGYGPGTRGENRISFSAVGGVKAESSIAGQSFSKNGLSYTTLLHELVHAATVTGMHLANKKLMPAGSPIAKLNKEAENILAAVRKVQKERIADLMTGRRSMTSAERYILMEANALDDARELIAWGTTDDRMQEFLESVKYSPRGGTAFTAMVDAIRDFIGLPAKESTALSAVLSVSDRLLKADQGAVADAVNIGLGKRVMKSPSESAGTENLPAGRKGIPDAVSRGESDKTSLKNTKVTDGDGNPLVVYHGSPDSGFTEFDPNRINASDPDGPYNGFWFSSDFSEAEAAGRFPWGRPNATNAETRPFYLDIRNPATRAQAMKVAREIEGDWDKKHPNARSLQDAVRFELQARGFDGIIHEPAVSPSKEAFERDGEVPLGKKGQRLVRDDENGGVDLFSGSDHITGYMDFDDAVRQLGSGTFVAFKPEQIKPVGGKGIDDIVSSVKEARDLGDALNSPEQAGFKLSANPIGDVLEGVWKATKAGAELLGLSRDDWKRYGEEGAAKLKDMREAFDGWKGEKFAGGKAAGAYKTAVDNWLGHWGRTLLMSNQGALQTLENLSGSEAIKDLRLMFDSNAGRGDSPGQTYGEAVQMMSIRHQNTINRVLDGLTDAETAQVTRLLQNRSAIRAGTKVGDAARALAGTLDELLKYQREAGINIGDVKGGYFPREVDLAAVIKDPAGFEKAAVQAYIAAGMSPADAKQAAVQWRHAVTMSGMGSPENPFLGMSTTIPHGDQMKTRQLTKAADDLMRPYLIQDPRDILNTYVNKAVRRAEFERRLGGVTKDEGGRVTSTTAGWDKFVKKLFDEGNGQMLERIIPHVQSMVGELPTQTSMRGRAAASWLQSLAVIQYLKLGVVSSLIEPMVAAQRTGDVRDLYRPMLGTIQDISNRMAAKLGGESWVSKDVQESREIAELLGITASSLTQDSVILLQTTGAIEGAPLIQGKKWTSPQALTNKAVTYSGLRHWTDATRNSMTRVGQTYIQKLSRDFLDGREMAAFHLADLGIQKADMKQFAEWVAGKERVGAGDIKAGPMGQKYAAALGRMVDQVIMSPKGSEKPYFTASPYGRVAYGLMSYLYGFQQNVLNRQARLMGKAAGMATGSSEERKEAAKLVGALSLMLVLPIAQRGLIPLRDAIRFRGEKRAEKSETENWIESVSRSGLLGAADPLMNMVTAARYEKDPASMALGPVLGTAQSFAMNLSQAYTDRNSVRTNTHERAMAKDVYNAVIDPILSTALVALAPAPVAIVGGQITAAEPVRQAFVGAVAGAEDPAVAKRKAEKRRREERDRAMGR
jgi:hypothetical protein